MPNTFPADLTLDLSVESPPASGGTSAARVEMTPYIQVKQHDSVRTIVTSSLLAMLAGILGWACFESASWPNHWNQTKEMLAMVLPALTGLIGSVIGFYFGSGVNGSSHALGGRK